MDRGACRAMVHRVAKSWTQLKRLSMHAHTCHALSLNWRSSSQLTESQLIDELILLTC